MLSANTVSAGSITTSNHPAIIMTGTNGISQLQWSLNPDSSTTNLIRFDLTNYAATHVLVAHSVTAFGPTNITVITNIAPPYQATNGFLSTVAQSGKAVINLLTNGVSVGSATNLNIVWGTNVVATATNDNGQINVGIHAAASSGGGGAAPIRFWVGGALGLGDSTSYYFGSSDTWVAATPNQVSIKFPRAGTISRVEYQGTYSAAGTSEAVNFYVRFNDATDNCNATVDMSEAALIATGVWTGTQSVSAN
jgi:hypothetical protein